MNQLELPAVVALGAACQIGQVVLLRELLMVFHGNELAIGIILAAWLAWVGAGSRWGGPLVERSGRPRRLLLWSAAGVLALLPATVLLIRVLRRFFTVLPGGYLGLPDMLAASFVVMAPACALLGAQFVLLARLWRERDGAADTDAAGKAYMGEAAGTILGGMLFTLVLVHVANSFQLALLAGLLLLAGALACGRAARSRRAWALLLAGGALALPLAGLVNAWSARVQWRLFAPDHRLVAVHPSKYGTITVAKREDQFSYFQSGHLVFSAAAPDAPAAALEEHEAAVMAHFALVQHPAPRRVLLIGGGMRGTLREILRHPLARVDYVELDPVLLAAARPHLVPATRAALEDVRVRVHHTDGRLFVKAGRARYDLILVDMPDPATAVLNRFYTVEFFREARVRLEPGGVLVTGVTSTPDLRGSAIANRNATLYHSLRAVFPEVLPVGERRLFVFAAREPGTLATDPRVLQARYRARDIRTEGFSDRQFEILLEEGALRRVNWILRQHGRAPGAHLAAPRAAPLFPPDIAEQERLEREEWPPVRERAFINSDFRPVGYFHTLRFWSVLARGGEARALQWIARAQPWWILPLAAAPLLALLALRLTARRWNHRGDAHLAVRFAVFSTGLSTMAMQVGLLFAFQSIHGFVYEMVGLIVAVFMAGLLAGTATTRRRVARKADLRVLAGVQLLIAVSAALIAVALPAAGGLASPAAVLALFGALTFAAGWLNGLDFPLAAACCHALSRRPEQAAATVYGIELFGACAGAALASAVVAPVLGIPACFWLAGVANAASFAVILLVRRIDAPHGA